MVLAGAVTVLELAEAVVSWSASARLQEAAAQGVAAWDVVTAYDLLGLPLIMFLVAAWIVTALWLAQVRENAQLINPWYRQQRSAVWAWLGWWVPIVALWFPFQLVRDVRLASAPWRPRRVSTVRWWWALWLLYVLSSQIGSRITTGTEPDGGLVRALGPVETFNGAVALAAVVLWACIVLQTTRDQPLVARERGL